MQNFTLVTLTQFLPQVPLYLAWLAGMVIALVTWRRHPPVSLLALLALALFAVQSVAGTLLFAWVASQPGGAAERAWIMSAIGFARILVGTAAWVLLLVALFGWRRQPAPGPPFPPPPDEDEPEGPPHPGIQKGRSWGGGSSDGV